MKKNSRVVFQGSAESNFAVWPIQISLNVYVIDGENRKTLARISIRDPANSAQKIVFH